MTTVNPDEEEIQAIVLVVIPQYHQAKIQTADGRQFSITRRTAGVHFVSLREGQRLMCTVTRRLPRVLLARAID